MDVTGIRSGDPLLAKQVLSQLSYRPLQPYDSNSESVQFRDKDYLLWKQVLSQTDSGLTRTSNTVARVDKSS